MSGLISRVLPKLQKGLEWLAVPVLGALVGLIVLDVVLRGVFKAPIFGSSEMANFLLTLSVGVGMTIAAMRQGHIRMDLLDKRMVKLFGANRYRRILQIVTAVGTLLFGGLVGLFAWESAKYDDVTSVLHWPNAPVFFIAAGLMIFAALLGRK